MQFRDHPLLKHHGAHSWPPVWTSAKKDSKPVYGEVGILRSVHLSKDTQSNKCFLIIELEPEYFVGTLIVDDESFFRQVIELLQKHINRSIQEIGDLDISHTL
jgi:hypothetical protein